MARTLISAFQVPQAIQVNVAPIVEVAQANRSDVMDVVNRQRAIIEDTVEHSKAMVVKRLAINGYPDLTTALDAILAALSGKQAELTAASDVTVKRLEVGTVTSGAAQLRLDARDGPHTSAATPPHRQPVWTVSGARLAIETPHGGVRTPAPHLDPATGRESLGLYHHASPGAATVLVRSSKALFRESGRLWVRNGR